MPNCRSISAEGWEHVHRALVFYFERRHGLERAQDLAQDTAVALLRRDDFKFAHEQDFMKVCYAFAGKISLAARRKAQAEATGELPDEPAAPTARFHRLSGPELAVMLDEVMKTAAEQLTPAEHEALLRVVRDETSVGESGAFRVSLHRARQKLARLIGRDRFFST